jgi:NSS family neurotransmitter:Na+ symporter
VAGWSIKYIFFSLNNTFHNSTPEMISQSFNAFTKDPLKPLLYQICFMIATGAIVIIGVQKGIERYSKILMPVLLVIIVILDIRAVTLDGAGEGLRFLFRPDFSKLTFEGVLSALGHAFFSLSLGMGTLITYGSYVSKDNNLVKTAVQVTAADTIIAILAGIAIFPAVFAFNIEPDAGVGLIFKTLPNVFMQMPGGAIFAILFFVLLTIAALTSAISILEVVVAYFSEELKIKRNISTIIATSLITLLGIICSLSLGIFDEVILFKRNIFDLLDHVSANILLPVGGMFIALFIGWVFGKFRFMREISRGGKLYGWFSNSFIFFTKVFPPGSVFRVYTERIYAFISEKTKGLSINIFMVLVKIIAPTAIFIVFLKGVKILDFIVDFITKLFN